MKIALRVFVSDTNVGIQTTLFSSEPEFQAHLVKVMGDLTNDPMGVADLIKAGKIMQAWDIWNDSDRDYRDSLDTYTWNTFDIDIEPLPNHGLSKIPPAGVLGKQDLITLISNRELRSAGYAEGASACFDWYNDRLQILVHDKSDEPALHVRLTPEGEIAEIVVRQGLMAKMVSESGEAPSQWQNERDDR